MLTDEDRAILDYEQQRAIGVVEGIYETFGILEPAFYARLNWLIDQKAAMEYAPLLCSRLRRLRDARVAARAR